MIIKTLGLVFAGAAANIGMLHIATHAYTDNISANAAILSIGGTIFGLLGLSAMLANKKYPMVIAGLVSTLSASVFNAGLLMTLKAGIYEPFKYVGIDPALLSAAMG